MATGRFNLIVHVVSFLCLLSFFANTRQHPSPPEELGKTNPRWPSNTPDYPHHHKGTDSSGVTVGLCSYNNNACIVTVYMANTLPTYNLPSFATYYWIKHVSQARYGFACRRKGHRLILLLLAGVEPNPGPRTPRYPCGICTRACKADRKREQRAIACDECDNWHHIACLGMMTTEYNRLGACTEDWICPNCKARNASTSSLIYTLPSDEDVHQSKLTPLISQTSVGPQDSIMSPPTRTSAADSTTTSIGSESDLSFNAPTMTSSPTTAKAPKQKTHKRSLRILCINFQSIRKKGNELEALIETTEPDVILGCETWLEDKISSSEFLPPRMGFNIWRHDRLDKHGGVLIAAKTELQIGDVMRSSATELITASVKLSSGKKIGLAAYYRPPNRTDEEYLQASRDDMSAFCHSNKGSPIYIGGDFNLPDIDWRSVTIVGNQYPKRVNNTFLEMIAYYNLEQQVEFPTRNDATLDLLLTSHPGHKQRCKPLPSLGNADHDIVLYDTSTVAYCPKPQRRRIKLWKRADMGEIRKELKDFRHQVHDSVESMWKGIKTAINQAVERHVPTKLTQARSTHPWINTHLKRMIKRKQRAHKKARKSKLERDITRYQRLQKDTRREIRKANRAHIEDISNDIQANPKRFWQFVKSTKHESSGVAPLKTKDGHLKSDDTSKAELLNDQFKSVYTEEDTTNIPTKGNSPFPCMKNIKVTKKGVIKLLQGLNSRKAAGPDDVPTIILKDAATELAPSLTSLFQLSLDTGTVPEDWKQARIVPVFKKGEKHQTQNYRPVSLTSICCKLLEHIIHTNIMDHFDRHSILHDAQHGFRKKRSCESQLILTVHEIARKLAGKAQVDVILLDFAKAFDKVPHKRLLGKLRYYGIGGSTLTWIEAFLTNRRQRVVVNGSTSTEGEVTSGVPQGTVLGPLLFLAFINDLPENAQSSEARLFADDCLLFRVIRSWADAVALQEDLSRLEEWETTWQMAFNPTKCSVLRIKASKHATRIAFPYSLHSQTLTEETSAKYLGVTLSNDLTWTNHIEGVAAKGNRSLGFVRRNFWKCPTHVRDTMYRTLVRPVLEYAAPVWDPYLQQEVDILERVQRRGARFATNQYRDRTPGSVTRLLHTLQWNSLQARRNNASLVILYKIKNSLVDYAAPENIISGDKRTRGQHKIFQQRTSTQQEAQSFFHRTLKSWNTLPEATTSAKNLEEFQRHLASSSV